MNRSEESNMRIAKALGLKDICPIRSRCKLQGGHMIPTCFTPSNKCPISYHFDTRDGFLLITEHGPKQEWWDDFLEVAGACGHGMVHDYLRVDLIGPQLAIELDKFLEGREGK